jgi:two-component system LytT family sensor kinase
LIFIAANYYFNSIYTIPHLHNKKRYVSFAVCFIIGVVLTAILRVPVSMLVSRYVFKIAGSHFDYLAVFYNSFINILFWVVVILTGKLIADKYARSVISNRLKKKKQPTSLVFYGRSLTRTSCSIQ